MIKKENIATESPHETHPSLKNKFKFKGFCKISNTFHTIIVLSNRFKVKLLVDGPVEV